MGATERDQIAGERLAKVEEFQRKHRTGFLTLLLSDIVGSMQLKQTLGDRGAVPIILRHHAAVREILSRFNEAQEIETAGDSFLLVFGKPSDAVKFSLLVQNRLRALAVETGRPVFDRIGIHVGEVRIESQQNQDKLFGIQVDTCGRVQALGEADQILLTRSPFDAARQALHGAELDELGPLSWLNHGPYKMKGLDEPIEICEVGEEGKAKLKQPGDTDKAHRYVSLKSEPVLGWRPAVDQAVPGTSWVLEKKLGEGGFGEVWLGRDKRLKTAHVFKFCFRAERVRSLIREVTLFRLLKERVGEHPNILGIKDVYFDEPPYYIVMDHVEAEALPLWCEGSGGAGAIPLAARLEIVAQVAEALQAAHDSGVIHRDVKPSNILVGAQGNLHAYLTDFGIGQPVSQEVLAGLTPSGFTGPLTTDSSSHTGSLLYLAPELLAGKAASIRSDIYALGVVLYQLLVGDFEIAVSPDWERRITDPLLRESLAKCFAGDPLERFAGAGQLAQELRSLEERRTAYAKEQAAIRERERAAYRRGVRRTSALALVVIAIVTALGVYAFVQRQDAKKRSKQAIAAEKNANAARDQADGLINFMLHDLRNKLQTIGQLNVLDDVAGKAKEYLDNLPKESLTEPRLGQIAAMFNNLGDVLVPQGKLDRALAAYQQSRQICLRLTEQDPTNTAWQRDLSVSLNKVGKVLEAQGKLDLAMDACQQSRQIFEKLTQQDPTNTAWQRELSVSLNKVGDLLEDQGKLDLALARYQQSREIFQKLAQQDPTNTDWQWELSGTLNRVAHVFRLQDKPDQALAAYRQTLEIAQNLAQQDPTNTAWQRDLSISLDGIADVQMAQGKLDLALAAYQQSRQIRQKLAQQDPTNAGWQRDLSISLEWVGNVLLAQGKLDLALAAYQQSREIFQKLAQQDPTNTDWQVDLSVGLGKVGDVLLAQGNLEAALKNYRDDLAITEKLAGRYPSNANCQNDAAWSRYCVAEVLIRIKDGDRNEARRLIDEGIDIVTRLKHRGALSTDAQDTLNKLKKLATALASSSSEY